MGIWPPNLGSPDKPHAQRLIKSAHPPVGPNTQAQRTKSAPLRRPPTASTAVGATVTFEEDEGGPSFPAEAAEPQASPSRLSVSFSKESNVQYADLMHPVPCPVVCRALMLGLETAGCRCSRTKLPTLTDLEYDHFLQVSCRRKWRYVPLLCRNMKVEYSVLFSCKGIESSLISSTE